MKHPTHINEARRQANILQRAQDLFLPVRDGGQGYLAYPNSLTGIWSVQIPEGTFYVVTLGEQPCCSCPDFAEHGDFCKHTVGLQIQLDREEEDELCAHYEATCASAELETTGCDPFAKF